VEDERPKSVIEPQRPGKRACRGNLVLLRAILMVAAIWAGSADAGDVGDQSPLGEIRKHFGQSSYFAVSETSEKYYVLASSPFLDADGRRSLEILAKALLLKHINKTMRVTGIDISGETHRFFFQEDGRQKLALIVDKSGVEKIDHIDAGEQSTSPMTEEIIRIEDKKHKEKADHQQLKELYFLSGDIDGFEKEADILMDLIFNE